MSSSAVPPLLIASPRTHRERMALYASPRALFSPRTHREQLVLTGDNISTALREMENIVEAVAALSARAEQQRTAFASANALNACPICMDQLVEPRACCNGHKFCTACLRVYRQSCSGSPRNFLCPLCRVDLPPLE